MSLRILSQDEVMQRLNEVYPVEMMAPITQMLTQQFQAKLRPSEFLSLSGQKGEQSFYLKVELLETQDQGTVFEFCMVDLDDLPVIHGFPEALLDFVGHVLESFFKEDREARLPIDFTPFRIAECDVYGRQEYRNFKLEREAEAWLQKIPKA